MSTGILAATVVTWAVFMALVWMLIYAQGERGGRRA